MIRGIFYGDMYNNHELNCSYKGHSGYYVKILDTIERLFNHMVSRHGKVFCFMFELNYPKSYYSNYPENNDLISHFMKKLMIHYNVKLSCNPCYIWARERSDAGQIHYHCILLLNGNKIRDGHRVLRKATQIWEKCLGIEDGKGLVHSVFNDKEENDPFYRNQYYGIQLIRCRSEFDIVYNQCFKAASYLAKCFSKGSAPSFANEFGSSRLPRVAR